MPRRKQKPTYPPLPSLSSTRPHPTLTPSQPIKPKKKRRRSVLKTFYSILYHSTFYFFILIIASLLVGSAYGLGQQAVRTGGQRRWNLFVLVAAYIALLLVSIAHVWSRILSIKKILRSMPKPYMPTKQIDVPKKVADHITTEYSRTAVIAHISQATTGQQEGWGRPGTKWENHHFRTYILSTLPLMRTALCPSLSHSSISLKPLLRAAEEIPDSGAIKLFVNSYLNIIERARYARQEPSEGDASACEKIVEVVLLTLQVKRDREDREKREKEEKGHGIEKSDKTESNDRQGANHAISAHTRRSELVSSG